MMYLSKFVSLLLSNAYSDSEAIKYADPYCTRPCLPDVIDNISRSVISSIRVQNVKSSQTDCTEKMVLLRQQNWGQQIKILLLKPNILLQQPNVLLTELNILLF